MIRPDVGLIIIAGATLLALGAFGALALFVIREFRSARPVKAEALADGADAAAIEQFVQSLTPADFAAAEQLLKSLTPADLAEAEQLGRTASVR